MTQAKPGIRLYVAEPYAEETILALKEAPSHYLAHVMRLRVGDALAVFNGTDGEWLAEVAGIEKKKVHLILRHCLRPQQAATDVWLAFAPIKQKSELVVEKAVELGVARLLPVVTRHSVARSVNEEKLAAHAIEAAEQSGRMEVPEIAAYKELPGLLADWPEERMLLFADESGGGAPLKELLPALPPGPYGVLIGPEGGFAKEEQQWLRAQPFVRAFTMGPRILRADTAAVAALACVQAWLGDWDRKPAFEAAE